MMNFEAYKVKKAKKFLPSLKAMFNLCLARSVDRMTINCDNSGKDLPIRHQRYVGLSSDPVYKVLNESVLPFCKLESPLMCGLDPWLGFAYIRYDLRICLLPV